MTEIKAVAIQIARPRDEGDAGMAEYGQYTVVDDMVTLVDPAGKPLMRGVGPISARSSVAPLRWERKLQPGENALTAAKQLLWAKYRSTKSGNDFNRPLNLPGFSVV